MAGDVFVDGRFVPREAAVVNVFDHGLLYGDGVFEGIRAYARRVFALEAHVRRLFTSARAIGLTIPSGRGPGLAAHARRARLGVGRRRSGPRAGSQRLVRSRM